MNIVKCDVLVIGGGGGALRAAIAAKEYDPALKVCIATKGQLGKNGVTALACSDRMAFHATLDHTEPGRQDGWKFHADDIYRIGGKVSDYTLAAVLAKNAKDAFQFLDKLGVPFVKKNGLADQFVTDGSDYARACYTGPLTAVHIEEALMRKISTMDIEVFDFTAVHKLLLDDRRIIGAVAIKTPEKSVDKAFFLFSTPAIILATGGGGLVYKNNVFPGGMTGDGYAMAYDAGAELVNMEFIQIGLASVLTKFSCSGSMMRAIPRLINDEGEEILPKYFPVGTTPASLFNTLFNKGASWPVSYEHKTHVIDIALYKETKSGHKVFLDYGSNPAQFSFDMLTADTQARYQSEIRVNLGEEKRRKSPLYRLQEINPAAIEWFSKRGIDLLKGDLIEVAACAQHFQGGIKIDEQARTTVAGLWAVGETAGGQHGANRPGGNALLDCQVFGKIAGEDAAHASRLMTSPDEGVLRKELQEFIAQVSCMETGDISSSQLREQIQQIMEQSASIIRTSDGLQEGMQQISLLKQQKTYIDKQGVSHLLETRGMLAIAEMILASAALRDESRGPHLRFASFAENSPIGHKDADWEKYIVIQKGSAGIHLDVRTPVI